MSAPLMAARAVSKSFGSNEVLKEVEFELRGGSAVALCGENGAGKSTLIKLLAGLYAPSGGHVEFQGEVRAWRGPRDSLAAGVAVVHQEFSTMDALSVAENIFLESEPRGAFGLIDRKRLREDAARLLGDLGIALDPDVTLDRLGVADKQMVEIAKALRSDAKVLILDEPTAVLSRNETRSLFEIVEGLRARGIAIVYVSHRLDEIFEICTDIVVIKDGVVTARGPIRDFTHDSIVSAMVGRELGDLFPPKADPARVGEVMLEADGLEVHAISPPVRLVVRKGEIVGLAGLVGSGRSALVRALFGARPSQGTVRLDGAPFDRRTPAACLRAGVVMLTESRKDDGLFGASSVAWNFAATTLGRGAHPLSIPPSHEERRSATLAERFNVAVDHVGMPVSALSGGNQQKTLFGRILENEPKVLLLDEPTRGVDVGAKAEIYRTLRALADEGIAILAVSSELIEIVGLCDRVYVMRDREIVRELAGGDITEEAVIAAAAAEKTATRPAIAADA